MLRKVLSFILIIHMTAIPQIRAEQLALPAAGTLVALSPAVDLPVLKGIKVHTDDPLKFEFIIDEGDKGDGHLLETKANRLIKYFLASLTTPEKDLWVNLSPYEKDRIVPDSFGQTEMGRDLLAQDYLLKQITASLVYPEGDIGKQFWKKVYELAREKNVPVNTFNKVWIVPDKAVVYENAKAGTAYVVESSLKVMTEQDYLATSRHEATGPAAASPVSSSLNPSPGGVADEKTTFPLALRSKQDDAASPVAGTTQIVRNLVIPQLTKEVNTGANFAQLRQVYNSLILATWYKKKIKDSILSQVYADQNKVDGIKIDDPKEKERIYAQYLEAFKKGAYSFIKEERDQISGQVVPRKYFSGGVTYMGIDRAMAVTNDKGWLSRMKDRVLTMVGCDLKPEGSAEDRTASIVPPAGAVKSERNYKIDEQGFLIGSVFDEGFVREEHQRSAEKPTIVFDMDGTMVGVIPPYLRPGIAEELLKLKQKGYRLVLWTGSRQSGVYGKLLSYPEMQGIFDLIVTADNDNNMDLSGLGEQHFRDLFLQFHEPMPQGKDRKKPINLFGYKLLVDDEQYSGKVFRSYEIALPVIGKEPTEGLADRLDAMVQSADIGSLSYNQWREKYKDSDIKDRAMSGEEKDGMQEEIKRLQQKRALTQTELEALEKELPLLNWEMAALVPWVENIHYAWEQPEPEVENELHLWENQIAVRREFLLLAASMMKNVHMTTEEFTQRLKEMNRLLIVGESGGNFYRGAITGLRQSEQSLLKKAGKPRDEQIFLERMPLLRSALEGLLQGLASSTDDEQYIRNVAWFYQKMINRYLFESGNNSLAMNMVNAMLRARGFIGISHHQLDMKYFKTVHPDDVLLESFFNEFKALVGKKDSAQSVDLAMAAPQDPSQQQARQVTLTIEASLIKRIVEQFQHKFHYPTELLRDLLFGSDLMQIRSIFLIDPVDWELLEAPLDQLEHKLIEKPVNGTRLRFKIERLMQLLKMASAHLPRSESELNDQEKKIVKMIGAQSSAVEAVNFRLLMAEAVNTAAIKIVHPPKESKIFHDHDTIMHDILMHRVLSMYRSARGSLVERSLLDNVLHSADEFFDDAVRRVNADQPDMVAHLEALWDQMLYLPLSDELYAAIAQYEWWFYKANSLQIFGAGIGDAMSTAMQLAKGIPLRKTFIREEFRAKGMTLSQYIKFRVAEFQLRVAKESDAAMTVQGISKEKMDAVNDLGGIDLDPSKVALEQRSSGGQIVMSVNEKLLERLSQARGFIPVVIAVVPLAQGTLGEFLNGGI